MKRILLTSIILASAAALLVSCSCGRETKEVSDAELNDSTKTAMEILSLLIHMTHSEM